MSKILIVEDEESIAELEKDYLELSGFEVEIENRGDTGLERALKEEFDLFILDLMLPGTDGFEICKRIRQVKNTPILMVSAKKDDIDKIRGLGLGADDYITKPFSPLEVQARVRSHLRRYTALGGMTSQPGKLINGGICLDNESRELTVDGETVLLTPIEYSILLFLMRAPGKVFSSAEIYRAVWKEEPLGSDGAVAVHIRHLREKIEINPSEPRYLKVIWGQGYKMEVQK